MSGLTTSRQWMIGASIACALLLAALLPRHAATVPPPTASADALGTVPPQLAAPDASSGPVSPSAPPADVVVYVCGAVRSPAVYHLASGMRVIDAIAKAGGASPDADLEQLNLAQPLAYAMKIEVPKKGQTLLGDAGEAAAATLPATGRHGSRRHSGARSRGGSRKLHDGQTLDVNTASADDLTQLPGVGPSLAARIVEYRRQNGPFETIDDLQNVSGIGPSKFEKLASFVQL